MSKTRARPSEKLRAETAEFLDYLHADEPVQSAIRAPRGRTLLYAGAFFSPIFEELQKDRKRNPALARLVTLSDVLGLVPAPCVREVVA